MKTLFYMLILLFWGLNINLFTQVIRFEILTTSNSEIPGNEIWCLEIDRFDYKWIAIAHGIASLDPSTYWFVYDELTIDGDPYHCSGITCITIDNFDKLWIGTWDGLVDDHFELYNANTYPNCPISTYVHSIAIDSQNNVWILGDDISDEIRLIKFDGNNWETFDTLNTILSSDHLSCISVDDEDNLWIGLEGNWYREGASLVKFDGNYWNVFNFPDSVHGPTSITIDDEGNKWMATGNRGWGDVYGSGIIKLSADDSTWTVYNKSNSGLTSNAVWNVSIDKFGNKWMATSPEGYGEEWEGGGLVKFDGNEWTLWDNQNSDITTNTIGYVKIDSKNNKWLLIDGNYGWGGQLAIFNENGIILDVEEDALLDNIPQEYLLSQNYPNPFNPSTTIKYSIPVGVKSEKAEVRNVTLKVFDLLGSEVVTLVNEEQKPGDYQVVFDGNELTSGIYFYRLQVYPAESGAGEYLETKKMILPK